MGRLSSLESKRRALALFERMLELPPGARRGGALEGEPAEVLMEVAALEAADARGAETFRTDFVADRPRPAGPRPTRVGPYRLEALVGEGGMGEVWRGRRDDGLFDLQVAIKLIRPEILSAAAETRFDHERRMLARLDHAGIARIIDGGVSEGGWPYLVTELVEGKPIDRYCTEAAATLKERIALVRDAASAIQVAHGQLVIHCDVKPVNLLVDARGRVRLVDFGIARLLQGDGEAPDGLQPMTAGYASPERIAGHALSIAEDIYALGCVLRDLAVDCPADEGVAAIVGRSTAANAPQRYSTMAAMCADLDNWLAHRPVAALGPSLRYRADRFVRRHRFGVAAAAVAALALIVAGVVGTAGYVRTERARASEAERVADLRSVSHYLLFDLENELASRPNSLAMRTRIAERLQRYLDRMAASPRASPTLRFEAAEGLVRLAAQQASPGRANLGQPDQARRNLERASGLLAQMPGEGAALLRARIAMDRSRLLVEYDQRLSQADVLLVSAGEEIDRAGAAGAQLRGTWLAERATLRGWQNRYAESVADARAALRQPKPADPLAAALLTARIQDVLAESIFYLGEPAAAVTPYRDALATLQTAIDRWPADRKVRRDYAKATWSLGTTLMELDRDREALPLLERGRAIAQDLVAQDRDDTDADRVMGIIELAYAQALSGVGRAEEGISTMAAAVERRRLAWQRSPAESRRARDYTIAIAAFGDLLAENGRTAQACRTYSDAEAMFDGLRRRGKLIESDQTYSYRLLAESRARYCPR